MKPIKPWSYISEEDWFKNLPEQEQKKVATQYSVLKAKTDSVTNQIATSKNRSVSEQEWEQFRSANSIPPEFSTREEAGLVTGEITKEALGWINPAAKGAVIATGAVGARQILKDMGKEVVLTPAQRMARATGQAGWLGSSASKNTPAMADRLKLALELKQKGLDNKAIWEDTGVFDFGAGARYFDLDVIDDYVKNKGKLVSDKGFVSLRGQVGDQYPSLLKHIPEDVQQKYMVQKDLNMRSAGLHDPNPNRPQILWNPNKLSAENVVPHEIQHGIQQTQKLSSRGYNTADAEDILWNSPKLLAKLEKKNDELLKNGSYLGIDNVAYDIYRHNIGEAEATINQVYHNFIRNEVLKGTPPEKIKAAVQKQNPYKLLQSRYNTKKLWQEKDVKLSASEQKDTLRVELEKEIKKLQNEEPKLKIKITKEDLEKTPKILKEQGF